MGKVIDTPPRPLSRRGFLSRSWHWAVGAAAALAAPVRLPASPAPAQPPGSRQASGVKVGEVTDTGATIWTRLTRASGPVRGGIPSVGKVSIHGPRMAVPGDVALLDGACPGAPGEIRLRLDTRESLDDARTTAWMKVSAEGDYVHEFDVGELLPATTYHYAVETRDGNDHHEPLIGRFRTAPAPDSAATVRFCVMTCQMVADLDHPDGFDIYPSMGALKPDFVVFLGDNVYYDTDEPRAVTPELASFHWQRMYSLPRHVELLREVPGYWVKDDHDTLENDTWPGNHMGRFTFEDGQRIFLEQVPLGDTNYRTFRWGRDLQVWILEGRDFRSPNPDPDGRRKTLLGRKQKKWLKRELLASDATWKVVLSPTPIVGPDRGSKDDNLADPGFFHEGEELRRWFRRNLGKEFVIVCGDRHWQYHSRDPETHVHEFSVGPASDAHAGGSTGFEEGWHLFHRELGGFLSMEVWRDTAGQAQRALRLYDVKGNIVHEWRGDGVKA